MKSILHKLESDIDSFDVIEGFSILRRIFQPCNLKTPFWRDSASYFLFRKIMRQGGLEMGLHYQTMVIIKGEFKNETDTTE
jgi:hypothetical protein